MSSTTYPTTVFLNIPVTDLDKSIAFYSAVGFVQNSAFSDGNAAQMSLPPTPGVTGAEAHTGAFKIMLLNHSFYQLCLPKGVGIADTQKVSQCIICISRESPEAVDEFVAKVVENGGRKNIRGKNDMEAEMEKLGCHGAVVADPDGHIIEILYMPPELYRDSK